MPSSQPAADSSTVRSTLPMLGVGDVLDGATIRAQVFLTPTAPDDGAGDTVYLRLTYRPTPPGGVGWFETTHRWMLGFGTAGDPQDNLLTSDYAFEGLFETVKTNVAITFAGAMRELHWRTAEQMVRDFILSCYDLTDEVEAAEATLVGLGAPVTVFPRALVE